MVSKWICYLCVSVCTWHVHPVRFNYCHICVKISCVSLNIVLGCGDQASSVGAVFSCLLCAARSGSCKTDILCRVILHITIGIQLNTFYTLQCNVLGEELILLVRKGLLILRKQFSSCWYKNIPAEINGQYFAVSTQPSFLYMFLPRSQVCYMYILKWSLVLQALWRSLDSSCFFTPLQVSSCTWPFYIDCLFSYLRLTYGSLTWLI